MSSRAAYGWRRVFGAPRAPAPRPPAEPLNVWAPRYWGALHSKAIQYPATPARADAERAWAWVWNFVWNLPCAECRAHAEAYLRARPPDLADSEAFQAWSVEFHNSVSARLGKPRLPFGAYLELYADERAEAEWRAGCGLSCQKERPPLGAWDA